MNRHRACGPAWAALCVALLVVPALFTGTPAPSPPLPLDAQAPQDAVQDLGSLLAALPPQLSPATAMGPAAHWLFPPEAGGAPAPPPSNVQDIFDMVRKDVPWEPVPIPDAPAGPEPLLAALATHSETAGFELPDVALLRAQIASLRLVPEAEDALSQLVLAYDEAVRLEAEAVRDLTPSEILLLGQQPDAVAAWFAEDPARTGDEFEALHQDLVSRVDFSQRLRAADLLLRTVEQVKDPLALPPTPLPDASGAAEAAGAAVEDAAEAVPRWPDTGDPDWDKVYALVGLGIDPEALTLPDRPHESLPEALANLAATLGVPGDLPLDGIDLLPASLADAVATIVTARRVGLESGDATVHSLLLMEATREALPTLEAWAALLDLDLVNRQGRPDAVALLEAALAPDPQPSLLLARGRGLDVAAVPDPPALATLLEREGLPAADALAAAAGLPAPVALGTAHALHGMQQFDARREQVLGPLDPATREVLERHTGAAGALLEAPSWTPDEAELVEAWARGMAELGPDGLRALQQSQVDLLASVEAAVAVLGPYAAAVEAGALDGLAMEETSVPKADSERPWYRRALSLLSHFQVIGTASAQVPPSPVQPSCTTIPNVNNLQDPPLSDCGRDVWFRYTAPLGRSVLITGFGSTTVRPGVIDRNPDLVIDLGGGDTYLYPVGSAEGLAVARVAIDLGGDDLYQPLQSRLGSGAAEGVGSVGVLWDVGGGDVHKHPCVKSADCVGAHGYGANGGFGVLLDGAGGDTYDARDSRAHGVGWAGGTGLLLDLGDGRDRLHAGSGQGYGSGTGSLGVLLNDGDGDNGYVTSVGNQRFQGGHSAGSAAVGILVDLGGKGTFYQNLEVPEGPSYRSFEPEPQLRQDDAVWTEATASGGLGLGIDSAGADVDDDGDSFPNIIELAAGSDPQDSSSRPGSVEGLMSQMEDLLESIDTDDPASALGDLLPLEHTPLCEEPSDEENLWRCPVLLYVGGTGDDTIGRPAHILIELGGGDTYEAEVAGPGDFWASGLVVEEGDGQDGTEVAVASAMKYPGVGSFALDLSGDDTYLTPPDGGPTQGAVSAFQHEDALGYPNESLFHHLTSTSLLLDFEGSDKYKAGGASQGSATAPEGICLGRNNPGAAWLMDFSGDDDYLGDHHSQGHIIDNSGQAGLIDLRGDDKYTFVTQARAIGNSCLSLRAVSLALVFDGGGEDKYHSIEALDAPPDEDDEMDREAVFSTQGYPAGPLGAHSIFIDEGNMYDLYTMMLSSGNSADVSHIKNDAMEEDLSTITSHSLGIFTDSPAWFSNHNDADGDGASTVVEFLLGSDSNDPDDHSGSFWHTLSRMEDIIADPANTTHHTGIDGDPLLLRVPGQLLIGGRGDTTFNESVPFMVALGGNNTYTAPNVGGALNPGVALVLDAGGGDTLYSPHPEACTFREGAIPPAVGRIASICPSLGGAAQGIAILADAGGHNMFHTMGRVDMQSEGSWTLDLVTQGASANNAVGALVTWDANNTFVAELTARVNKTLGPTTPITLTLRGVAQGASIDGVGLLATFGGGDDHYEAQVTPLKSLSGDPAPTVMSLAQGAAWASDMTGSRQAGSYGLLLDGGGSNRYLAPEGYGQGFAGSTIQFTQTLGIATPHSSGGATGILWSGTGNDRFDGDAFSQGAALGEPQLVRVDDEQQILLPQARNVITLDGAWSLPLGFHYDAGGHDAYHTTGSFSQGAGLHGVGVLIDVAGDDRYLADAVHVQGVGMEGQGILLDIGGHDIYRAQGEAHGVAADFEHLVEMPTSYNPTLKFIVDGLDDRGRCTFAGCHRPTLGLLYDSHGHDSYLLEGSGHGSVHVRPDCVSHYFGLFLDTAGQDRYAGESLATNGQQWLDEDDCPLARGLGVDTEGLDMALEPLSETAAPVLRVELDVLSGEGIVPPGGKVAGTLLLRATVHSLTLDSENIHRVVFLANSQVVGYGNLIEESDPITYEFLWPTASTGFPNAYPDGDYHVWASTFLGAGANGHPDAPAVDSPSHRVRVDNPPLVVAGLEDILVSPAQDKPVSLVVQLGRDLDWPVGLNAEKLCEKLNIDKDCHPGARIHGIRTTDDGLSHTIVDEYRPAGTHVFDITGRDGVTPWADGWYNIGIEATDTAGNFRAIPLDALLVDGTPPISSITTPIFANEEDSIAGGSALRLQWDHSDGDGSGVEKVCVVQFDDVEGRPDGDGKTIHCLGPSQTTLQVSDVQTGNVLHFLTIAVDKAGNLESPCTQQDHPLDDELCSLYKAKEGIQTVTADFDRPKIRHGSLLVDGLEPQDAYIRPGSPVNFTVDVTDVGSGVGRVEIRLPSMQKAQPMDTLDGSHFWYNGWGDLSGGLGTGREDPLIISVTAFDQANNKQPELQTATLDDRAPVVFAQDTEYVEVEGETERILLAGRPGLYADVRARISDAALSSITLDMGELTGAKGELVSCDLEGPPADPGLKTCRVRIPPGTEDGDYLVWFNATDRAGNTNATESAIVEVRSEPLDLQDIRITSRSHNGFRVEWETEFDGTSTVHHGLTGQFGQTTSLEGHRTEHAVEVTGLAPSSTYAFQVVSENTAGIPSRSATFTVTTLNAYTFEILPLPDMPLRGVVDVGYDVSFLDGDSPIQGTLSVQDAAGAASPFEVTTVEMDAGIDAIALDTRQFADGAYRFVFELDRAGDFQRVESPVFRIDNTEPVVLPVTPRPASTVAETTPSFEVVLLDSMGTEPPVLSSLRVHVDGVEVPVQVESEEVAGPSSLQRRVVFTLPEDMEQGPHDITISVSDRAGNVGRADWPLTVDTFAPVLDGDVEATPLPGPDAAKPGGRLHVAARLLDDARVASVHLDLSVLQGTTAPLLLVDDRWEATVDVPIDAPHGRLQVPVVAVDGLGNEGVAGHVAVTVDAFPPRIVQALVHNVTYTSVEVDLATDKPTRAWTGDGPAPEDGAWDTEHLFLIDGLAPGQDHAIALHIIDRAGFHVVQTLDVTTSDDDQPPGAVGDLAASSPTEGVVALAWTTASDNAGIQSYRVERSAAERAPAMKANLTQNATTFRDDQAPAGRTVTYRVTPVDVAGLEGPASELIVEVLAAPHLFNASVTPEQGASDEPFTFHVEYRHAADRAADRIHVRVGDRTVPLERVDDADACHDGCLYRASARLPPSSLFGSATEARFEATAGGQQGTLIITDLPFVLRAPGGDGVIDLSADGRAAPGPGLLAPLLLLAASAALFRRRNHP